MKQEHSFEEGVDEEHWRELVYAVYEFVEQLYHHHQSRLQNLDFELGYQRHLRLRLHQC